jgi:hypothetical protein
MNEKKLQEFAALLEREQIEELKKRNLACESNILNIKVRIIPGKKYTKVDIGPSGRYMVTEAGEIFGIKAYGVIHLGHQYGTLDTIADWYWGGYVGRKNDNADKKG